MRRLKLLSSLDKARNHKVIISYKFDQCCDLVLVPVRTMTTNLAKSFLTTLVYGNGSFLDAAGRNATATIANVIDRTDAF